MPNNIDAELAETAANVADVEGAADSAIALINSIGARIQAAVDAARAEGATPAQLQAFDDLQGGLTRTKQKLADAVAANP